MKTAIRDRYALLSLAPTEVIAYLRAHGWKELDRIGNTGAVWGFCLDNGRGFEALVPLDKGLADYALRMGDILQTLELVEGRSQAEIIRDITTASADVIRIRLRKPEDTDGTIRLDAGVALVEKARDLLAAAASAAVSPRPSFHSRRPDRVADYLQKVRLGQTEQGSYVVTVISKVPPELVPRQTRLPIVSSEEPFERVVTLTLANALAEARKAADRAAATGALDAFEEAVTKGVSSNLCLAVSDMAGETETGDVEVRFSWAVSRPVDSVVPRTISFPADIIPVVREAGRLLSERIPDRGTTLYGYIVKLERHPHEDVGTVTILDMGEDRVRHVRVELDRQNYELALSAHQGGKRVTCLGDLYREGRWFVLRNLMRFEVDPAEYP